MKIPHPIRDRRTLRRNMELARISALELALADLDRRAVDRQNGCPICDLIEAESYPLDTYPRGW